MRTVHGYRDGFVASLRGDCIIRGEVVTSSGCFDVMKHGYRDLSRRTLSALHGKAPDHRSWVAKLVTFVSTGGRVRQKPFTRSSGSPWMSSIVRPRD